MQCLQNRVRQIYSKGRHPKALENIRKTLQENGYEKSVLKSMRKNDCNKKILKLKNATYAHVP